MAVSWNTNGELHCNLNGVYTHVSSNFAEGLEYVPNTRNGAKWIIGSN